MEKFLNLEHVAPLFRGGEKDVYQHPHKQNLLVKVICAERRQNGGYQNLDRKMLLARFRRAGVYRPFLRATAEMFRHFQNSCTGRADYPFERPLGFVRTNFGIGIVVEKIKSEDGSVAPTLRDLIDQGAFNPLHYKALKEFFQVCVRNHIVFGEMHAANLVYDHEVGIFVCIDSIGEKSFIPINEWSKRLNARRVQRAEKRLLQELTNVVAARRTPCRQMPPRG